MTRWKPNRTALASLALGALAAGAFAAGASVLAAVPSPEQRTLEAARLIRPLSDDRWKEIAGTQLDQEYEIIKGDTLWGISQRLFGEGNYWPKLWALNGATIANPHWIQPGARLAFKPGTTTSLPTLAFSAESASSSDAATASDVPRAAVLPRGRSMEWRDLPPQSWEEVKIELPREVDPQGFDLRGRYKPPVTSGFDLPALAASSEFTPVAEVSGSDSALRFLLNGDTVVLKPENEGSLEPGRTYAVTREPATLKQSLFSRSGYVYPIEGQIKVIGQRNGTWIGQVTSASGTIEREETFLVDVPVRFSVPEPQAAPETIEATLMLERGSRTSIMAQHNVAFLDRGSDDGVRPGMVFRAFHYEDPVTESKFTSEDIVYSGDCTVLYVSERFSTVLITSSVHTLEDGMAVKALTDVSSLIKDRKNVVKELDATPAPKAPTEKTIEGLPPEEPGVPPTEPKNELDELEGPGSLTEEEKKNLEQLEKKEGELPPPEGPPPNLEETPTAPVPEESTGEPPAEGEMPSPEPTPTPTPTPPSESEEEAPPAEAPPEAAPEAPPEF